MRIYGTVTDAKTKEPLFGANVYVSDSKKNLLSDNGRTKGAATDPDGKYELNDVAEGSYITFSHVGYGKSTMGVGYGQKEMGASTELLPESASIPEFTVIEERDAPTPTPPQPYLARKAKNYTPYLIGGLLVVFIVGGIVTYRIAKS